MKVPARFSVIQRDTVRDWILASDVVVSSYSTSLIEAGVAERPFAMVEPESLPDSLRAEWHAMAPRVRSEDELVALATGRDGADAGERLRR